jgi:hypothetical protein
MKKACMITVISLFFAVQSTFCWDIYIRNATPFTALAHVQYLGCSGDEVEISPGHTAKVNAKACLMTKFWADIFESAQPLSRAYPLRNEVKRMSANVYESSGQRAFSTFVIYGPIYNEIGKPFYYVSRHTE